MNRSKISIVIPTRNENDESYLLKMSARYPSSDELEYLIIDTDSKESLLNRINRSDFRVLRTELQTRAERLQRGFEEAEGELIVFHHPRSLLPEEAFDHLIRHRETLNWGGFTHQFDELSPGLKFTSWYSNKVRPRLWKILYLDHCLFFKKDLLTQKIPAIPIFEDTEISKILRASGRPQILPFVSQTSAIRFQRNGFWKQALKNQSLKIAYLLDGSPEKMNAFYEKHINLN